MCRKMFAIVGCLIIFILSSCGVQATTTSPTQQPVPTTAIVNNPLATTNPAPTELPVSETVVGNDATETIPTPPTQQTDIHGVIIDTDAIELDVVQSYVNNVEDLWTPTQDDVLQLEAGLATYLQQNAEPEHTRVWQELADYKRQYVGIIQDGQPSIYTNFFCEGNISETLTMLPLGGGDCYFQVIYNVDRDLFSYLNVHGES